MGSVYSVISMFELGYNHTPYVKSGILKEQSEFLMQEFFKDLRNNAKKLENIG